MFTSGAGSEPSILGGLLSPLGWDVGFVELPHQVFVDALVAWRQDLGAELGVQRLTVAWPACLRALDPLESSWTTELVVAHGDRWTAYLNNDIGGGDPWPASSYIAGTLGARWVIAMHNPMTRHGHASTQLWLGGPDGEPPLGYLRTITADAADRRWSWETSGPVQPFERPEVYQARRIKDRFSRDLLVDYLNALGIGVDDDKRYGESVVLRQRVTWPRRTLTLDEARREML